MKLETTLHQGHVNPAEAGIQKVWQVTQSMDFVPMPLLRLLCFASGKVRPAEVNGECHPEATKFWKRAL